MPPYAPYYISRERRPRYTYPSRQEREEQRIKERQWQILARQQQDVEIQQRRIDREAWIRDYPVDEAEKRWWNVGWWPVYVWWKERSDWEKELARRDKGIEHDGQVPKGHISRHQLIKEEELS